MTPHQLSQVESKITAAVLKVKQEGKRIRQGHFGIIGSHVRFGSPYKTESCLCPIGALLDGTVASADSTTVDAAKLLDITSGDVWGFVCGFDGSQEPPAGTCDPKMIELGRRFRNRLD